MNLRLDDGLLARIDKARGDVPRNRWIVRAAEQALEETSMTPGRRASTGIETPAPAEQPRDETHWRPGSPGERLLGIRSSSQSKRDVRPIPKGKS